MHNEVASCITLWIGIQAALFVAQLLLTLKSKTVSSIREIMGWTLPLAKACAMVINFNSAMAIVSKRRIALTLLASKCRTIGILEVLHKWFGVAIGVWSIVHTLAHIVNYDKAGNGNALWTSGTTITGFIMLFILLIIWVGSFKVIRMKWFRVFTITHLFTIPYLVLLVMHGAFCLLRQNSGKCNTPTSWYWIVGPVALWIIESIVAQWRVMKATELKRVIVHPSFVIELLFDKPSFSFQPGQYVFVKVPLVSLWEWHPFTLTSSPHDELHTVHVRVSGKWTKELADKLFVEYKPDGSAFCHPLSCLPEIMIDGPYGHGWTKVLEASYTEGVVICIGAGIGQTPFANLEEKDEDQRFKFKMFVTGSLPADQIMNISLQRQASEELNSSSFDTVTGLLSPTQFGRPNFRREFGQLSAEYGTNTKYSVFFCGPPRMADSLEALCKEERRSNHNYHFYSESFE